MILRVPYPALDDSRALQLATQLGEMGRHPLKSDDPVPVFQSKLAHKNQKVTYPCLTA
jgi:hypothetical protein